MHCELPCRLLEFAPHCEHARDPCRAEYDPAGHCMHHPLSEYVPAGQMAQLVPIAP